MTATPRLDETAAGGCDTRNEAAAAIECAVAVAFAPFTGGSGMLSTAATLMLPADRRKSRKQSGLWQPSSCDIVV